MNPYPWTARGLAEALAESSWRPDDLVDRAGLALGRRPRWLRPLVGRLMDRFPGARPSVDRLAGFLADDGAFRRAYDREPFGLVHARRPAPAMAPGSGPPSTWPVPPIATEAALAGRLGLEPAGLDWLADRRGTERVAAEGPVRRYDYRWRARRDGPPRLIEAPRPRLKSIQRRVLDEILAAIPPHDAAHGFRPGRSVRSFVGGHAGRAVVLRLDLLDFFPSIPAARVLALFRTAGYPEGVAQALAGLCTNRTPGEVWRGPGAPAIPHRARQLYRARHLPQGSPTSPALANLSAYRLDCRLAGLARSAGATYTRYADDLAFSGGDDLARSAPRFLAHAGAVVLEEGFAVNHRKTRVMRRGTRQRLAGVVLNDRPNVARDDFDALKAILHNCREHGPDGQDRSGHPDFRAHLSGRIAHVATLNPARAEKLRAIFEGIAW